MPVYCLSASRLLSNLRYRHEKEQFNQGRMILIEGGILRTLIIERKIPDIVNVPNICSLEVLFVEKLGNDR